jgi:hypothetical protein
MIGIILGAAASFVLGIFVGRKTGTTGEAAIIASIRSGIAKFEIAAETDARKVLADLKKRL